MWSACITISADQIAARAQGYFCKKETNFFFSKYPHRRQSNKINMTPQASQLLQTAAAEKSFDNLIELS